MIRVLVLAVTILAFTVGGGTCLMWPDRLQLWWIRHHETTGLWRLNPFFPFMRSRAPILFLRLVGLMMLSAAAFLCYVLALNPPTP